MTFSEIVHPHLTYIFTSCLQFVVEDMQLVHVLIIKVRSVITLMVRLKWNVVLHLELIWEMGKYK